LFHFSKKYVGASSNTDFITLDDWVRAAILETEPDLILQIDIEGFEYEVFLSASDRLLRRCRIIVAEFHSLDQLWNRPFFDIARRAFEKLLQTHACVHIHPNNCSGLSKNADIEIPHVMEFTFIRRDRIRRSSTRLRFPHPLDRDNGALPSIALPPCWYSDA
jgi:hypothetical protein